MELFVFYSTFDSLEHYHRIMETISSFIGSGADVGTVWTFHTAAHHIAEIGTPSSAVSFAFDLQLSALSTIQLYLKNELEFPRVQEMCIANGAILYARCQVLEFMFIDEKGNDGGFLKQYELSEQESRDFVGIYEDYLSSWRLCGADPIRKALRRQIQEFAGRLDDDRVTSIARENYKGSRWRTHRSRFQPDTLGLKMYGIELRNYFFDAPSSQHPPNEFGNFNYESS